jgi:hypothetical protein
MNIKLIAATFTVGAALAFTGCTKDEEVRSGSATTTATRTTTLTTAQQRALGEKVNNLPKLRLFNPNTNRFIDMDMGNRDYVFSDPDEGFTFDDPDQDGFMTFSDGDDTFIVFNLGVGVAGQGGGGFVVAGETALNMDFTVCLSAAEVGGDDDGFSDFFDSGADFDEFGVVVGISGDFEGLMDADTEGDDFDPFEFFHGYAAYYVIAEDLSGSHEVLDWFEAEDDADVDGFAFSFVMDFTNFNLYFASSGTVNVAGGTMSFNGEYFNLVDVFESFLDGEESDDADVEIVSGYGQMGCN